jgi:hypothetical protein
LLDVDKPMGHPDVLVLAAALEEVPGVDGVNDRGHGCNGRGARGSITPALVVHSVDQACVGERLVERVIRAR